MLFILLDIVTSRCVWNGSSHLATSLKAVPKAQSATPGTCPTCEANPLAMQADLSWVFWHVRL